MWFKVDAEQHTSLIQSLQQWILGVFTFFSFGSSSLVWPDLFLWSAQSTGKKGLARWDHWTRPLFCTGCYRFQYKLKAILTPCATEEWSGHARLQSVLHGFLLFWIHYFSDFPMIGCNNGKMMTMTRQWSSCSWAANLAFYCKVLVQQRIKLPHVWTDRNSRFDRINKPLVPAKISRK